MMLRNFVIFFTICFSFLSSWDGYDYYEGEGIQIGCGNLVRRGEEIEVYHESDGSYHYEEVEFITGGELETYDYEVGEYRYYVMD